MTSIPRFCCKRTFFKYSSLINDEYILCGDTSITNIDNDHHISHCENIECFTNVKVDTDQRMAFPSLENDNLILRETVIKTKDFYNELEKEEETRNIIALDREELMYDLIDLAMEWSNCLDEISCKSFLRCLGERGISVGDFTKAILKIVTIVHEIEKACVNDVELLYKCSLIAPMILKYITTSQSLYI